jgi:glycosyltransferase involved in cell wall biosynthesis
LFLLARLYGGNTFSRQVMEAAAGMDDVDARFVLLDNEDYDRYRSRAPWLNRRTGLWLSQCIMRLKLLERPPSLCDAVFVQGFELATCLSALRFRVPAALAHDSTNVSSYRLIRDESPGFRASLACALKSAAFAPRYRRALRQVRAFLPRTRWAAESLVRDFGVHPDRILVTPAGVDLDLWSPRAEPRPEGPPVLLFVGNDFRRKGGPLLLEIFRRGLLRRARLRIVSNDPALPSMRLPPGVEHLAWLKQGDRPALLREFRDADLFVFPTRKEQMGMVLTEAAAVGLPMIATEVGGVGEIVRHRENGLLLPREADAEAWAAAIGELLENPERRAAYGRNARALAEEHFSRPALASRLRTALESCWAVPGWMQGMPQARTQLVRA